MSSSFPLELNRKGNCLDSVLETAHFDLPLVKPSFKGSGIPGHSLFVDHLLSIRPGISDPAGASSPDLSFRGWTASHTYHPSHIGVYVHGRE